MAAPKLRFHDEQGREYPEWETKKIGDYFKVKDIKTIDSKETPLMAFVANKGIAPKGKRYDRSALVKTANKQYKRTDYGDFIYSSNNLDVGSIGLNLYGTAAISPVYEIFESKMKMNLQCINTLIQRPKNLYNVLRFRQGVIYGQLRIHPDDFLKVTCSFPSLPEQEKISNFLTTVDHQIEIQSQRVEAMKTRKKGLLQKIFSQEIRFKDDQGKNYPAWEGKYLSDIASFHSGLTYTPGDVVDRENGILVFRSSNVQGGRICYSDNVYVNKKLKESNYVKIHDIVVCVRNGSKSLVGKNALITENDLNATWGAFMTVIRAKENPGFIHQYLNSDYFKKEMYKDSGTATINQITTAMLNNCKLLVPSLPEQQKIADFLTAVDHQIEVEEKRLETMKNIKKGLLQQMFI